MGGFGECPCCKNWKSLTEHHVKELAVNDNIPKLMVCDPCHKIIEEYIKVKEKMSKDPWT